MLMFAINKRFQNISIQHYMLFSYNATYKHKLSKQKNAYSTRVQILMIGILHSCSTHNGTVSKTTCHACYYDDEERALPKKCAYKCGANPSDMCLRRWGKCVKKRFNKKYGKVRII